MENKTKEELYQILRSGTDEEARQAEEELVYRDQQMRNSHARAVGAGICVRNFSHNVGEHIKGENESD